MNYTHKVVCSCGKYRADFDGQGIAEHAAEMHVMLGDTHHIVCTNYEGVVRFTCDLQNGTVQGGN